MARNAAVAVVLAMFFMAACGTDQVITLGPGGTGEVDSTSPSTTNVTTTSEPGSGTEGGFGPPAQGVGEFTKSFSNKITGTLYVDTAGCWTIEINGTHRMVVMPTGFEFDPSSAAILVGPDGTPFASGAPIDGEAFFEFGDLISGGPDGRWGNLMDFCDPELRELVVLDVVEPAFDPTALTPEEIDALVREADFTEVWPCGLGFALSTADQRVGVVMYANDIDTPPPTIVFPDESWTAEVIVGKHLFVQSCDDVIEEWEAESIFVGQFPMTAGELRFLTPPPVYGDRAGAVEAELVGAVITTGVGALTLPDLALSNVAYGFFAG